MPPPNHPPPLPAAAPPAPPPPAARKPVGIRNWLPAIFATGFLVFLGFSIFRDVLDLPFRLALPAGAVAAILVIAALMGLSRDGRRALRTMPAWLPVLMVLWRRKSDPRDIRAARHASGNPGRLEKSGPITLWTDHEETTLAACLETMGRTRNIMHLMLGRDIGHDARLRLWIFSRTGSMLRYSPECLKRRFPVSFAGYYTSAWHPRIVLTREFGGLFPLDSRDHIAHEYTHHLHLYGYRHLPPVFLIEGVAIAVAAAVAPPAPAILHARQRCLDYLEARGALLGGDELIGLNQTMDCFTPANPSVPHAKELRAMAIYMQSRYLFDWLCARHREPLVEALTNPAKAPVDTPGKFLARFGVPPGKAMAAALEAARLVGRSLDAEPAGDRAARRKSVETLFSTLLDPADGESASKTMALRLLPSLAHGLDITPLREFHKTSEGPLRDAAALAIDMLDHDPG